jgi:hypothetical protein
MRIIGKKPRRRPEQRAVVPTFTMLWTYREPRPGPRRLKGDRSIRTGLPFSLEVQMSMVDGSVQRKRGTRLKVAGTALLLLAALLFIGSFVAAANTPTGYDASGCRPNAACDPQTDSSNRQNVFFLWMGATLGVFAGGVWMRSVGNRSDVDR